VRALELDDAGNRAGDHSDVQPKAPDQRSRPLHPLNVSHEPANVIRRRDEHRIIRKEEAESRVRPTFSQPCGGTMRTPHERKELTVNATATALTDERVLHTQLAPVVVAASDLTRRYGEGDTAVDALRGVSLEIAQGELTAVMGPSGSGKSTLMHILAGLDTPTSGTVEIGGEEITSMSDSQLTKLRRRHIGFVFQFFNLLPMLSAEENVVLPLSIAGTKPDAEWLEQLIADVGLQNRRTHRPSELSGGQQQRVAIARSLVTKPTVLFADEPTGNLDSTTSGEILELLRNSVESRGQTTVMVTHDARAATIADRILFLADGLIVRELGRSSQGEILETLNEVQAR
jgi:putative ABC transport system ATP-binding protein